MKTYLVTHGDLDGIGAAILAKIFFCDVEHVFYADYTTVDNYLSNFISGNKQKTDIQLLITDICPSESTCEELAKVAEQFKIHVFDHHKTRQWAEKYPWVTFDTTKCGTSIFFDYLKKLIPYPEGSKLEEFVQAVEAWDLWKLDSPFRSRGEQLNALHKFVQSAEFIKLFVNNPDADKAEPVSSLLHFIQLDKEAIIRRAITNCQKNPMIRRDSLGNTYLIVFTSDYVSEVCHAILEHPDFDDLRYVVAYSPMAEACSLRTKNAEIDVSDIAKRLGGGGHKDAAGFYYPIRNHIEENIFKLIAQIEY